MHQQFKLSSLNQFTETFLKDVIAAEVASFMLQNLIDSETFILQYDKADISFCRSFGTIEYIRMYRSPIVHSHAHIHLSLTVLHLSISHHLISLTHHYLVLPLVYPHLSDCQISLPSSFVSTCYLP